MGENTLCALPSDLAYLQAWAVRGAPRHWPAAEAALFEVRGPSSVELGETGGPAEAWDPPECGAEFS